MGMPWLRTDLEISSAASPSHDRVCGRGHGQRGHSAPRSKPGRPRPARGMSEPWGDHAAGLPVSQEGKGADPREAESNRKYLIPSDFQNAPLTYLRRIPHVELRQCQRPGGIPRPCLVDHVGKLAVRQTHPPHIGVFKIWLNRRHKTVSEIKSVASHWRSFEETIGSVSLYEKRA